MHGLNGGGEYRRGFPIKERDSDEKGSVNVLATPRIVLRDEIVREWFSIDRISHSSLMALRFRLLCLRLHVYKNGRTVPGRVGPCSTFRIDLDDDEYTQLFEEESGFEHADGELIGEIMYLLCCLIDKPDNPEEPDVHWITFVGLELFSTAYCLEDEMAFWYIATSESDDARHALREDGSTGWVERVMQYRRSDSSARNCSFAAGGCRTHGCFSDANVERGTVERVANRGSNGRGRSESDNRHRTVLLELYNGLFKKKPLGSGGEEPEYSDSLNPVNHFLDLAIISIFELLINPKYREESTLFKRIECDPSLLSKIRVGADPRRLTRCSQIWSGQHVAYRCLTCGVTTSSCICVDCFQSSNHEGHDYYIYKSDYGGCCDCGDEQAWSSKGFCRRHGEDRTADSNSGSDTERKVTDTLVFQRLRGLFHAVLCHVVLLSRFHLRVPDTSELLLPFHSMLISNVAENCENHAVEEGREGATHFVLDGELIQDFDDNNANAANNDANTAFVQNVLDVLNDIAQDQTHDQDRESPDASGGQIHIRVRFQVHHNADSRRPRQFETETVRDPHRDSLSRRGNPDGGFHSNANGSLTDHLKSGGHLSSPTRNLDTECIYPSVFVFRGEKDFQMDSYIFQWFISLTGSYQSVFLPLLGELLGAEVSGLFLYGVNQSGGSERVSRSGKVSKTLRDWVDVGLEKNRRLLNNRGARELLARLHPGFTANEERNRAESGNKASSYMPLCDDSLVGRFREEEQEQGSAAGLRSGDAITYLDMLWMKFLRDDARGSRESSSVRLNMQNDLTDLLLVLMFGRDFKEDVFPAIFMRNYSDLVMKQERVLTRIAVQLFTIDKMLIEMTLDCDLIRVIFYTTLQILGGCLDYTVCRGPCGGSRRILTDYVIPTVRSFGEGSVINRKYTYPMHDYKYILQSVDLIAFVFLNRCTAAMERELAKRGIGRENYSSLAEKYYVDLWHNGWLALLRLTQISVQVLLLYLTHFTRRNLSGDLNYVKDLLFNVGVNNDLLKVLLVEHPIRSYCFFFQTYYFNERFSIRNSAGRMGESQFYRRSHWSVLYMLLDLVSIRFFLGILDDERYILLVFNSILTHFGLRGAPSLGEDEFALPETNSNGTDSLGEECVGDGDHSGGSDAERPDGDADFSNASINMLNSREGFGARAASCVHFVMDVLTRINSVDIPVSLTFNKSTYRYLLLQYLIRKERSRLEIRDFVPIYSSSSLYYGQFIQSFNSSNPNLVIDEILSSFCDSVPATDRRPVLYRMKQPLGWMLYDPVVPISFLNNENSLSFTRFMVDQMCNWYGQNKALVEAGRDASGVGAGSPSALTGRGASGDVGFVNGQFARFPMKLCHVPETGHFVSLFDYNRNTYVLSVLFSSVVHLCLPKLFGLDKSRTLLTEPRAVQYSFILIFNLVNIEVVRFYNSVRSQARLGGQNGTDSGVAFEYKSLGKHFLGSGGVQSSEGSTRVGGRQASGSVNEDLVRDYFGISEESDAGAGSAGREGRITVMGYTEEMENDHYNYLLVDSQLCGLLYDSLEKELAARRESGPRSELRISTLDIEHVSGQLRSSGVDNVFSLLTVPIRLEMAELEGLRAEERDDCREPEIGVGRGGFCLMDVLIEAIYSVRKSEDSSSLPLGKDPGPRFRLVSRDALDDISLEASYFLEWGLSIGKKASPQIREYIDRYLSDICLRYKKEQGEAADWGSSKRSVSSQQESIMQRYLRRQKEFMSSHMKEFDKNGKSETPVSDTRTKAEYCVFCHEEINTSSRDEGVSDDLATFGYLDLQTISMNSRKSLRSSSSISGFYSPPNYTCMLTTVCGHIIHYSCIGNYYKSLIESNLRMSEEAAVTRILDNANEARRALNPHGDDHSFRSYLDTSLVFGSEPDSDSDSESNPADSVTPYPCPIQVPDTEEGPGSASAFSLFYRNAPIIPRREVIKVSVGVSGDDVIIHELSSVRQANTTGEVKGAVLDYRSRRCFYHYTNLRCPYCKTSSNIILPFRSLLLRRKRRESAAAEEREGGESYGLRDVLGAALDTLRRRGSSEDDASDPSDFEVLSVSPESHPMLQQVLSILNSFNYLLPHNLINNRLYINCVLSVNPVSLLVKILSDSIIVDSISFKSNSSCRPLLYSIIMDAIRDLIDSFPILGASLLKRLSPVLNNASSNMDVWDLVSMQSPSSRFQFLLNYIILAEFVGRKEGSLPETGDYLDASSVIVIMLVIEVFSLVWTFWNDDWDERFRAKTGAGATGNPIVDLMLRRSSRDKRKVIENCHLNKEEFSVLNFCDELVNGRNFDLFVKHNEAEGRMEYRAVRVDSFNKTRIFTNSYGSVPVQISRPAGVSSRRPDPIGRVSESLNGHPDFEMEELDMRPWSGCSPCDADANRGSNEEEDSCECGGDRFCLNFEDNYVGENKSGYRFSNSVTSGCGTPEKIHYILNEQMFPNYKLTTEHDLRIDDFSLSGMFKLEKIEDLSKVVHYGLLGWLKCLSRFQDLLLSECDREDGGNPNDPGLETDGFNPKDAVRHYTEKISSKFNLETSVLMDAVELLTNFEHSDGANGDSERVREIELLNSIVENILFIKILPLKRVFLPLTSVDVLVHSKNSNGETQLLNKSINTYYRVLSDGELDFILKTSGYINERRLCIDNYGDGLILINCYNQNNIVLPKMYHTLYNKLISNRMKHWSGSNKAKINQLLLCLSCGAVLCSDNSCCNEPEDNSVNSTIFLKSYYYCYEGKKDARGETEHICYSIPYGTGLNMSFASTPIKDHITRCGNGLAFFLHVSSSIVICFRIDVASTKNVSSNNIFNWIEPEKSYIYSSRACEFSTLYVDEYGEEDRFLSRGKPLTLCKYRLDKLQNSIQKYLLRRENNVNWYPFQNIDLFNYFHD
ncbi:hypothetical protein FG386_001722 [Cryptosporidium ryanae]|uniref:uncharacterized protein n=1 Tax=Cryptosporidium ryanae TaxID=515981 RepID=UPI00351A8913|nr:hypothetical protein FG386_001722 [Cryptosporidium ryanae]